MGKTQVLNKAVEIALKSNVDDVFIIMGGKAVKLEKGRYGGWLLRPPLENLDVAYGVWCYKVEEQDADEQVKNAAKDVQEKVAKVAGSLGVDKTPQVSLTVKRFRAVKVVRKKAAERYSVYEIEPTSEEAAAALAHVYYHVWWSRRGKCHGELCSVLDKFAKLLSAEFKEDAEVSGAGVYVPYDVSALETLLSKLPTAREEAEADRGAAHLEEATTYFIVVKFPNQEKAEEAVRELEEAVRQKLKELNITAAVWSVKADL